MWPASAAAGIARDKRKAAATFENDISTICYRFHPPRPGHCATMVKNSLPTPDLPARYARYGAIVRTARPRSQLWRLALGIIVVFLITPLWAGAMLYPNFNSGGTFEFADDLASRTLALLLAIGGLGIGTIVAAWLIHRRRPGSLIGRGPAALRHFVIAALVTWSVAAGSALLFLPFAPPLIQSLSLGAWLSLLPLALIAVLFQTGAEEIFFRGYLQSQLAARFRRSSVWILGPALFFGLMHYAPFLSVLAAWTYVVAAALFGILAADLTARTGTLGAAWGFHFANNVIVLVLVAPGGELDGLSLYRSPLALEETLALNPAILVDALLLVLVYRLIRWRIGV